MNVLVWLKRDLRLHDHPALTLAAGLGPVLPVYIAEPSLWSRPDASARQWEFVAESLADLREAMAGLGLPLVIRLGEAVEVLDRLCRQHRIARIISHQETGIPADRARDRRVEAWAQGAGMEWTKVPQPAAEGDPAAQPLPLPAARAVPGVEPGAVPGTRALKLAPDPCPHRQLGGRTRGLDLLDSFLARRGEPYRSALASPLAAERACSRLSPHLAWGTLSGREVAQATAIRQAERPGGRWTGALAEFRRHLAARDRLLRGPEDGPGLSDHGTGAAGLQAWAEGETGLPFLDACLRYLRATGWLSFPLRAMVASVATGPLGLESETAGQELARRFTDYAPAIHWPQILALSGGPGGQRAPNPVRQGLRQDPTGGFTRRWLPELAAVPEAFLHEPWKWPEARRLLGHRYPEPLVDFASAPRPARKVPARRVEAAQLVLDLQAALPCRAPPISERKS
ncbi:FAD-binding domain-containing protein [Tabrizicola soli]|uniref:FAD-binding domain-containing protein n=1 Tax=Tabrizicola soli TaxID=2185115 RepID=A0ABV7DT73_9RHOB|nr:FAD-binding domain-containing protein [Tabrizicola soli]